jgi:DNA-binding transcriptional MerR regulator
MTIGLVANAAGVSVDTLRFYERHGLIARPRRNFSGYRIYAADVLDRLRFIADAKALGFSLREIKELVSLGVKSTAECGPVTRKAQVKLAGMNSEIRRLQRLRRTLGKMIEDCGGCVCSGCVNAKETIDGSDHLHQHRMLRLSPGNGLSQHAQRALRRKEPRDRSSRAR